MNVFLIILFSIIVSQIFSLECEQDQTPLDVRVEQSSLVVVGTSLIKTNDLAFSNLFNVTFLVQCILKGQPTPSIIQIAHAGSLLGRRSCQKLATHQEYIVFLEPFFDGTYRPADFQEIAYDNQLDLLLEKTCGLSRAYPRTDSNDTQISLTNKCPPAVSLDCPTDSLDRLLQATTTSDWASLSALLNEQPSENLTLAFLDHQHRKSLISDDDSRTNRATATHVYHMLILLIQFNVYAFLN